MRAVGTWLVPHPMAVLGRKPGCKTVPEPEPEPEPGELEGTRCSPVKDEGLLGGSVLEIRCRLRAPAWTQANGFWQRGGFSGGPLVTGSTPSSCTHTLLQNEATTFAGVGFAMALERCLNSVRTSGKLAARLTDTPGLGLDGAWPTGPSDRAVSTCGGAKEGDPRRLSRCSFGQLLGSFQNRSCFDRPNFKDK
jgi:hypothetical protein